MNSYEKYNDVQSSGRGRSRLSKGMINQGYEDNVKSRKHSDNKNIYSQESNQYYHDSDNNNKYDNNKIQEFIGHTNNNDYQV